MVGGRLGGEPRLEGASAQQRAQTADWQDPGPSVGSAAAAELVQEVASWQSRHPCPQTLISNHSPAPRYPPPSCPPGAL